jgi:hypothetical protein
LNGAVRYLQDLDEAGLTHRTLHPRLKQVINVADMLYFIAEQDNHRLTAMAVPLQSGA